MKTFLQNQRLENRLYIGFFALMAIFSIPGHKIVLPLILLLGLYSLIKNWAEIRSEIKQNRFYLIWVGFYVCAFISSFFSPNFSYVAQKATEVLLLLLFGSFAVRGAPVLRRQEDFKPFLIGMLVLLAVVLIELIFKFPLMVLIGRLKAEHTFYKDFANYMILFLTVLSFPAFYLFKEKIGKPIAYGFLVLVGVATILGVNMAALLGFVGGLVALIIAKFSRKLLLYVTFVPLIVGTWIAPFFVQFFFGLRPEFLMNWKLAHAGHRLEIWDFIAKKSMEQPFTGFGLEAAKTVGPIEYEMIVSKFESVTHPHNFMIQLWFDMGVLGVALATAFFFLLFQKMKTNMDSPVYGIQMATLVALLSSALFSYGMWQGWWIAFLFATATLLTALHKSLR